MLEATSNSAPSLADAHVRERAEYQAWWRRIRAKAARHVPIACELCRGSGMGWVTFGSCYLCGGEGVL